MLAPDLSTRPATASSFFRSSGSRAEGAVMMAPSSARSEPTGHGSCSAGKSRATRAIEPRDLGGVLVRHGDHGGDVDVVVLRVPAIVIGHHGDGGIGDLGLAGELGLGHVGHADHVVAELLVGDGFGIGRELRALDADVACRRGRTGCSRPPPHRRCAGAAAGRPDAPWAHGRRSPGRRRRSRACACGRRTGRRARRSPG